MKQVHAALLICGASLLGAPAFAQTDVARPDPTKVKLQLGPVIVNPTITLGNIGSDGNVFNDPSNPKSDLTMTLSPKTELWLPFLASWFQGTLGGDYTWYREYTSERSTNNMASLNWRLPLTRLTADLGVSRLSTRDRPGFEIDARAQHVQTGYLAGASLWFLANTSVDVLVRRNETDFDENALFQGVSLRDELNATVTSMTLGVSQKLTPLTTVSAGITSRRDRFTFNPLRDADATDLTAAVRFDPAALLKGGVTVGYTQFEPASDTVPRYTGTTLAADLAYTPFEVTRVTFRAERAVRYSFEEAQPYYVQTGFTGEVTQQIFGPVDVVGRVGSASLDYQNRVGYVAPDRADRVIIYGLGFGYHVGRNIRIGFNADQNHRDSPISSRRYERLNFGSSMTYDF